MRVLTVAFVLALVLVFAGGVFADDDKKLGIAVLNPTIAGNVAADLPPVLAGLLATRLEASGVFRVVSEEDVKRLVSFDQMKTALSCDEQASCLGEIGAALGVPWLLTSSVAQIGSSYVVNLALIDIEHAKSVKRETATYPNLDAVVAGLPAQVERAAASLLYREKGRLLVLANEEGATVAIDGSAVGTTPLAEREIASGPHRITISKDGFIEDARDVVVKPREQTMDEAKLRSTGQRAVSEARMGDLVRLQNDVRDAHTDYWPYTPLLLAGLGVGIGGIVVGVGFGLDNFFAGTDGHWTLVGTEIGAAGTFGALELAAGITVFTNMGMEADIAEKQRALDAFKGPVAVDKK